VPPSPSSPPIAATSALAPDVVRVRGTIDSVNGQMLNVTSRDGAKLQVKVADNAVAERQIIQSFDNLTLPASADSISLPRR
jgi:hypothetical protein